MKMAIVAAAVTALAGGWIASAPAGAATAAPGPAPVTGQFAAWTVTHQLEVEGNSALATDPATGTVYVGAGGPDVEAISGQTGQKTGEISLPAENLPAGAAVNPATGTVYITAGQAVYAASATTGQVTATITDTNAPGQIAVNPSTNTVYVTGSDSVTVIDGATNTITTTISIGNPVSAIAVDQATNTVYVAGGSTSLGAVTVIDGATNTVTGGVSAAPYLQAIAVNPRTNTIYAGGSGSTSVISGATDTVTATIDDTGTSVAVDPQTDTIYLTSGGPFVIAVNGATNQNVTTLVVGDPNQGSGVSTGAVAVDPASGLVYVSYLQSWDVFEVPSLAIIATCGSGVVITPGSGCAKVAAAAQPTALSFASPALGVVLSESGLLETSDGGKQWSFLPRFSVTGGSSILDPADDSELLFTSADNGWLLSRWHTGDGGASWQWGGPDGRAAVAMAAAGQTVYAAGPLKSGARGLFTRPASASRWTQIATFNANVTGLGASWPAVWLTSQTHLWATADGRHWHEYPARCPGTGYDLAGVAAASSSHVAFLCTRPAGAGSVQRKEILVSDDGGRTVHLAGPLPAFGIPHGFASPAGDPSLITLAVNGNGPKSPARLYLSANGGRTWTTITLTGSSFVQSLTYTSRTSGWMIAGNGSADPVRHSTDGGRTWHAVTF
jgi:DNA-binding beta-propeller fold protein YncE